MNFEVADGTNSTVAALRNSAVDFFYFYIAMKDYYALLRVPRTASDAEIKQAFRRLAILLHPDKNPHPDAPLAFQEINEAYEVLGDPIKRILYDQMLMKDSEESVANTFKHRDPAYQRRRQPGYKPAPREPSAGELVMAKLMPYTNWVSWAALTISFFVWLDFALPRKQSEEIVIEWHRQNDIKMITDKGHSFHLLYPENLRFLREPEIRVYTSSLFSFLDRIETKSGSHTLRNLPSVFRNFFFGPVILVVLGLACAMLPRGDNKFNFAIATVIFLLLNTVFIIKSVW
jgi:curved DNA-binding protein CbpA